MGKGGGSAPPPPDPGATAAAQSQANKEAVHESARVNQINEISPYGTLTYTGTIGDPDRTRTTTLNPVDMETLNLQRQLAQGLTKFANDPVFGGVKNAFATPLNYDGIAAIPGAQDLEANAQGLEKATFERAKNLFQPEFDRQQRQTEGDLLNRGLYQGSEAYTKERNRLDDSQNRALTDAALAAVSAGRAEQSRALGAATGVRQQQITERERLRAQPLNELAALLQGAPAINSPQFAPANSYNVAPADVTGAINTAYGGQVNAYNQNQARNNATMGGLFGLGGSALGAAGPAYLAFSDRRLKRNIRKIGQLASGLAVYLFQYLWSPVEHIGVMADEAETFFPEAVFEIEGYRAVDYSRIR